MIKKYINNGIEVEAVQFTNENKDMVYNWAKSIQFNVYHSWDDKQNAILKIPTLDNIIICSFGDYIIVKPFPTDWCKLYCLNEFIFKQNYILK